MNDRNVRISQLGTITPNVQAQGAMNEGSIENFLPGAGSSIGTRLFGEAALDLDALFGSVFPHGCFAFGSIWMHSRSSTSFTSQTRTPKAGSAGPALDYTVTPSCRLLSSRARPSSATASITLAAGQRARPSRRTRRSRRSLHWIRVRIPGRPNGRTGWVRRDAPGRLHVVTTALRIDKARSLATLRRDGRTIWRSPIGHGAPGTPTPSGRFWIRERLDNRGGDPVYGPTRLRTSAYSALSEWPGGGVIGIHGTYQPGLIPGRPSHGCIRVPNPAIRRLARLMPIGTPVLIR